MVRTARTVMAAIGLLLMATGASAQTRAEAPAPTFSRDVAPIVYRHCASCHHPEGPGRFSLLTFVDARPHARQMAVVTASRYMPPWKPDQGSERFIGAHRLSAAEIDTIRRWAESGAAEGDRRDVPPRPALKSGWQLGAPDLVVDLPAYDLPASGADTFRIFVVPVTLPASRFVRGFEFRPGASNLVHHANIRIDRTPASRTFDADDPAPGYDGLLARSATFPDGHFLAWTPGQVAPLLPKGLAWRLDPTTDLVVELHLQPTGKPERVRPSIALFFGDDPPEQVPTMVRLGRQNFDIAPGDAQYLVTDSFTVPVDVQLLALQPHAHYRAREILATATLPDRTERTLISIPDWDFRWQQVYRLTAPMALPAGTTLTMRYRYDNSAGNLRSPQPPQRVIWGQRSSDEMGDLWLQVLTRNDNDRGRLDAALRPKVLAEDLIGYEARIRVEPDSVGLHDDVALLYLEEGRTAEAIEHLRRSVALRPASAAAHFNLGTALSFAGQDTIAVTSYTEALRLRPDYALAHNNLGGLLLRRGDLNAAAAHLDAAVRLDPSNADAQQNLGLLLNARGDDAGARERFIEASRLRPDWPDPLLAAAWVMTTGAASVRDAPRATLLAQQAVRLTAGRDARALDVLAAAYAEGGDVTRAMATAQQALALATGTQADEIRRRLQRYRAGVTP